MTDQAHAAHEMSLPPAPASVHFIGIGGVSMSGLAALLQDNGYRITGSDAVESPVVTSLQARGIPVVIGHADPVYAGASEVVVSTRRAEMQASTELDAARANGALIVKRGQLLGMIANPLKSVAVAGTHGKSTTSGMLTMALLAVGQQPGYAVGASLPGLRGNTAAGSGDIMIVEADEFDRSFLWLRPQVSIITSVSFDHPDIYADQQDYDSAFTTFARQTKPGGTMVIAADDPGCQRVIAALGDSSSLPFSVVTFGESAASDWRVERNADDWIFYPPLDQPIQTSLLVPGMHNARNAIAAVAGLAAMGLTPAESTSAVSQFSGVGRRFEHKGTVNGIDVVDDYAHHPDEIAAVVAAARMRYPGRRIFVVHQPHTYSRTKALLGNFAAALDLADEVVLLAIYPGGETDDLGTSSAHLLDRLHVPAQGATGPEEASAEAVLRAVTGDIILTLGAGDITRTGSLIMEQLKARAEPAAAVKADHLRRRTAPAAFQIPGTPQLKVTPDAPMSMYTTMRVGGPADFLVRAPTPGDVVTAVRWAADEGLPVTVIGGGSNLLVGDSGIRGLVIVARTPGERAGKMLDLEDGDDRVRVSVGAQAPLSWVGRYCAEHGWAGMDWGVGLPGQIGGATVNNAGAHGTELKDHLVGMDLLHMNGEIEPVGPGWLEPSYRMTRIKEADRPRPWIVLRSIFELPKHDSAELVALADEHAAFRKRTQPTGACSGSTFANPEGDFAGRLLEAADLKGHRMGAMQLSPKHANWVVNMGGGTAREAWELIRHGQASVFTRFGVVLRPEIERLGEPWDDDEDGSDSRASPAMKG